MTQLTPELVWLQQDKPCNQNANILQRGPRWIHPSFLTITCGLLIIYGSSLPFEFDFNIFHKQTFLHAITAILTSPTWQSSNTQISSLGISSNLSDLITNLALYLPFGFFLRLTLHKKNSNPILTCILSMLVLCLLCYLIECSQSLMPNRFPSLNDMIANSIPGCFAAIFALRIKSILTLTIFWLYTKSIKLSRAVNPQIPTFIKHPYASSTLLFLLSITTTVIYLHLTTQSAISHQQKEHILNLLPFAEHFARSYDVAIAQIGSSIITYSLVSITITVAAIRRNIRLKKRIILLGLALFACLIQITLTVTRGFVLDITEPLLAVTSLMLIAGLVHLGFYSINTSCRRKHQVPVKHDRRQKPHIYKT